MADVLTSAQRSYNMSRIKDKDTKPEIALRRILFSNKIRRYRLNSSIKGKSDIVFSKKKLAIFIDGCFWHKCPKCFQKSATNKAFWVKKIDENVKRDVAVTIALKLDGWTVVRIWEHEIRKNLNRCSDDIISKIKG